jgi:hypothetical protein
MLKGAAMVRTGSGGEQLKLSHVIAAGVIDGCGLTS